MFRLLREYKRYCNINAIDKKLYKFFLACIVFMLYKNPFKLIKINFNEISFLHQIFFNTVQLITLNKFIKLIFKCRKNKELIYDSKYENTKPNVFYKLNTEHLYIKDVKHIIPNCFWTFINLKTVVISKDVVYIGHSAFKDCISLEKVLIPNTLSKIESNAFMNCINLKQVIFYDTKQC